MLNNGDPRDEDMKMAIGNHYERVEMDDVYKNRLLADMLNAARPRRNHRIPTNLLKWTTAIAAMLIICALVVRFTAGENADRLLAITYLDGKVVDGSGHRLEIGDYLSAGNVIITGSRARVTLVTRNGSLLHLDENSKLSMDAKGKVAASSGRLYCSNRMHDIAKIDTPSGSICLLGTVLDASLGRSATSVTVVEGKVRLVNSHGKRIISAGNKAVMAASKTPESGCPVNTAAETAWYDGRNRLVSDTGKIAYVVYRATKKSCMDYITEIWTMNEDGFHKRLVAVYPGTRYIEISAWCPGSQWVLLNVHSSPFQPIAKNKIRDSELRLLNVRTGKDLSLKLPGGFWVMNSPIFSPNYRYLAFVGIRLCPAGIGESGTSDRGIWIYDLRTKKSHKISNDFSRPNWSPDSRHIVTSEKYKLVLIDTRTNKLKRLGISGYLGSMSPKGDLLAYIGGYSNGAQGPKWAGSVNIFDMKSGKSRRITPAREGAFLPKWSPDGSRILYYTLSRNQKSLTDKFSLFIVDKDGKNRRKIFTSKCLAVDLFDWGSDGKKIYARIWHQGKKYLYITNVLAIDPNGVNKAHDLGGHAGDSMTRGKQATQIRNASTHIFRADFCYHAGIERMVEGNPAEARKYFRRSSKLLAEAAWKFPLAKLNTSDLTEFADTASDAAALSNSALLAEACERRMQSLRGANFGAWKYRWIRPTKQGGFPSRLPKVMGNEWNKGLSKWARILGEEWTAKRISRDMCPGKNAPDAVRYIYKEPTLKSKAGDIIVRCPNHKNHTIKMTDHWIWVVKHSKK